ncbi:LEAF RUST 10 DISEASE-RESISTANCE LOCUS RECEPTOR-LIKE PROTEIN KINASE-like 1.4 isoform X5 [Mangifera indica]|uniref:LEAF RUST 10 DISEASE-RESISTANCE LOCUS RECEPTOR-LIKE PROTEIN KINASE-like 1.4 isoform X5 n=1 Tax=Mangifera indica TaxID=29780 RepID=UPI001CFB6FAE|nr:LEAF RUST 10 DISEASE-RESISTANCE LOCUS RECEPTOR-LIKE PROTEIN KINASE-like 1.4 isoform X5 [Mangifera indica]
MSFQLFSPSPIVSFLCFLLVVSVNIQPCLGNAEMFEACKTPFRCGHTTAGYPFWGDGLPVDCHPIPGFNLSCENEKTTLMIGEVNYVVLSIDEKSQALNIARKDIYDNGICHSNISNLPNTSFFEHFEISEGYKMLTLRCGFENGKGEFTCSPEAIIDKDHDTITIGRLGLPRYVSVNVTLPEAFSAGALRKSLSYLEEHLKHGFQVKWKVTGSEFCDKCLQSSGRCGYPLFWRPSCYCIDRSFDPFTEPPCPTSPAGAPPGDHPADGKAEKTNSRKAGEVHDIVIGALVASGAVAIFLVCCCIYIVLRRRKNVAQYKRRDVQTLASGTSSTSTTSFSKSISSHPYTKSDLEKGSTYFGAQVFTYAELEQATDNFDSSKELGDGGFGTVYYGELKDGRSVAVKRLYENTVRRVEQFKNEIEILTRLRHPNLVALYGCTSRHSRELLLVYEYIPNGTVADHLHGSRANSGLLTWPIRLNIAIETAKALAFLHVSDVIHRDVKTNNILLDDNFHVKVADFGLSRFFPDNVTHVSTAPQGTPGYVDPEYYQCYQLTEKSDVYSFGVVLMELISSLEAVDTNRHRHDINLSNMAVSRIQNHALQELVDPSLGFENNYTVRNMITSAAELAFRCLQQDREVRPSMQEILQVLKEIQNQQFGTQKAEEVDFYSTDDSVLLRISPPPLSSPDSGGNDKWVRSSSTPSASY